MLGSIRLITTTGTGKLSQGDGSVCLALPGRLVLATLFMLFVTGTATASQTLDVEASGGLPGFQRAELEQFLALHMAEARLADWRFAPEPAGAAAPNRIEWRFKLNAYAGGEVRSFGRARVAASTFAAHRPITIEARLYLNGEYQTLVEKQAVIQGGANDPDLTAAVIGVTQSLLGPQGAFQATQGAQHPIDGPR